MPDTAPLVHNWLAGDSFNSDRMNEIVDQINFLRNPPMVHVGRTLTTQTIPPTTWTFISFDTVFNNYDPYDMFDPANPTYITAQVAGWYTVEGQMTLNGTNTQGRDILGIYKNVTTTDGVQLRSDFQNRYSGFGNQWTKEFMVFLNVGDTLYLGHYYDAADATRNTLNAATTVSRLRARWIST